MTIPVQPARRRALFGAHETAGFGVDVATEVFQLNRLDPVACYLELDGERISALVQTRNATPLERGDVHKDILRAAIPNNEAEPDPSESSIKPYLLLRSYDFTLPKTAGRQVPRLVFRQLPRGPCKRDPSRSSDPSRAGHVTRMRAG
jgi:hypothetical protein